MRNLILILALTLASACGMSPIRQHSTAIIATSAAHQIAVESFDSARHSAFEAVTAAHPRGEERNAALDVEAARWRPAAAALDLFRRTITTWAESVDAARRTGAGDELFAALVPVLARVVQMYADTAALLRALGVPAPPLPALVSGLANATVGQ